MGKGIDGAEAARIMYGQQGEERMSEVNNMELWNKVCKTDPIYTKKVTLGRAFTAIDPMYQVMKATEVLGVAGVGWGFTVEDTKFLSTDQVAMKVRVWCGKRDNYIEHWGQSGLYIDNKKTRPDTDCMKKATTDGITKCLSYFGFNADVFLGKFDDNRYVEELNNEKNAPKINVEAEYQLCLSQITNAPNKAEFVALWNSQESKNRRASIKKLREDYYVEITEKMKTKIKEFENV